MAERQNLTVDEENVVARAEGLARQRQLRDAMLALFGTWSERSAHGALVLAHLEAFAQMRLEVVKDVQERTDIYRTGVIHGRQQVVRAIRDALEWREPTDTGAR